MSSAPKPIAYSTASSDSPRGELQQVNADGDFDIPLPDEDPIRSDFGRLEAPFPVASMEEQRRIAEDMAWLRYNTSGQRARDEIDRAHRKELDAGLHNLHEPFKDLIP